MPRLGAVPGLDGTLDPPTPFAEAAWAESTIEKFFEFDFLTTMSKRMIILTPISASVL